MRNFFILVLFLFFLGSCSEENKLDSNLSLEEVVCNNSYKIGEINKNTLKLKGVVISDDVKVISSPMAGVIDSLNCEAGTDVNRNTLIANISPDFNNPNIINLSIQKGSLINQKFNLESVRISTISNFDNQISDLKEQVIITERNIELTKKSSHLNKDDLEKQIKTLTDTLFSLETNLDLVKKAKIEALAKIDINKESISRNLNSISSDNLLKIDEVFGITEDNKYLNDKYDNYLSAKDGTLLNEVRREFERLNKIINEINNLTDNEVSKFLGDIILLNETARNSIKESIINTNLTQTQVDGFYTLFLTYGNSLTEIKSSWDSLDNSKSSIAITYDTQISSLTNQIDTSKISLENLQTNKLDSIDVGLDLQLSNLDSGLKTLSSNLENLLATKKSQVLSLDNQILQVEQNIDSLNTNLSSRSIYAGISGIIKQKISSKGNNVGINTSICQIIPNNNSTKIKIYSPIELEKGDKLLFNLNGNDYEIQIENVLVYKDPITQNYIYESNYLDEKYFKDGEILSLNFEESFEENSLSENEQELKDIKIPVSYVKNKINGNFVKINSISGVLEKEIELGNINGDFIEIKEGLEGIGEICK